MSQQEYAVLIGKNDIKVTRIITNAELDRLSMAEKIAYNRDRSIGENFYFGCLVEACDPFCALLEAKKIARQDEVEDV